MSVACFVVVVVIVNDTTSDMGHGAPSGTATCPWWFGQNRQPKSRNTDDDARERTPNKNKPASCIFGHDAGDDERTHVGCTMRVDRNEQRRTGSGR
jgi:hypothetical protein